MVRILALLLFAVVAFAQAPPVTPPLTYTTTVTVVPDDPTLPVTYTNRLGERIGIIGNLFKVINLDSTAMANLKDAPIEIVAAPAGLNRYLFPYRLFIQKMGDIDYPTASPDEGGGYLQLNYTDQDVGFIPATDPAIWSYQRDSLRRARNDVLGDGDNARGFDLILPAAFGGSQLKKSTKLKIGARVSRTVTGVSEEETWVNLWDGMQADSNIRIYVYYNIVP